MRLYAGRRDQIFDHRYYAAFRKAKVAFSEVDSLWWTAPLHKRQTAILKAAGVSFWEKRSCAV